MSIMKTLILYCNLCNQIIFFGRCSLNVPSCPCCVYKVASRTAYRCWSTLWTPKKQGRCPGILSGRDRSIQLKVLLVATVNKDMSNDLGPLTAKIKLSGEGLHCQIWPFRFVAAIPPQCKPALGNARNKLHILKLQFFCSKSFVIIHLPLLIC